jgi:hypothetical protein
VTIGPARSRAQSIDIEIEGEDVAAAAMTRLIERRSESVLNAAQAMAGHGRHSTVTARKSGLSP